MTQDRRNNKFTSTLTHLYEYRTAYLVLVFLFSSFAYVIHAIDNIKQIPDLIEKSKQFEIKFEMQDKIHVALDNQLNEMNRKMDNIIDILLREKHK